MTRIDAGAVAERLHAAAIRLIRHVRAADVESKISPPKLSVLSILAFAGSRSLTQLAAAEQVSPPTMSKLIADLEREGLVSKRADAVDRRGVVILITAKGRTLMDEGRRRRLALLRRGFVGFTADELKTLSEAAELMLRATKGDE